MADFETSSINLGPSAIKTNVINNANKGISFNTPISRFTSERRPIVLEWTPLDSPGKFGKPIRTALLINPESMDFNRQHVYSQQQTRGGWIHTHWGDKPMVISVRGNTGLYQHDFIHRLEYFSKINGKSYAEIDALTSKANQKNRDYILSLYLGVDDAKVVQDYIQSTTIPGQTLLKNFLTNDAFYKKAEVLGSYTFRDVKTEAVYTYYANETQQLLDKLELNRQKENQQRLSQQANNNLSSLNQTNTSNYTAQTNSLPSLFGSTQNIPGPRLLNSIFNTSINQGIVPSFIPPVSYNSLLLQGLPGALLPTANISNTNYSLLQNFLSQSAFSLLLQNSTNISSYANRNLRLDNPLQYSQNIVQGLGNSLGFYQSISQILLNSALSLITMLSTEEDLLNQLITSLNDYIVQLNQLQDLLTVLRRQIKIQSKRFDTNLLSSQLKRLNEKIIQTEDSIQDILQIKDQLDSLLITPLANQPPSAEEQALSKEISERPGTQSYVSSLITKFQIGAPNGPTLDKYKLFDSISLDSKTNDATKNYIRSFNLAIKGVDSSTLGSDEITKSQLLGYTVGKSNQILRNNGYEVSVTPTGLKTTDITQTGRPSNNQNLNYSAASQTNSLNTTTNASTIFTVPTDRKFDPNLSVVRDQSIADKFQNENLIFNVTNGRITPSKPDIIRIKMYYNNVIYEGFMENLEYSENAATPNITYSFNFVVEKEFLGASFADVPNSLLKTTNGKSTPGLPGDIDPTLNTTTSIPSNQVTTNITGKILTSGATFSNSDLGSSGTQNLKGVGSANINLPVASAPTDSTQLNAVVVDQIKKDIQLKNNKL